MKSERPSSNCACSSACSSCSEPSLSHRQRRKRSPRGVGVLSHHPETAPRRQKQLKSSQRQARSRPSRPRAETGRRRPSEYPEVMESPDLTRPVHLTVILRVRLDNSLLYILCTFCKDTFSSQRLFLLTHTHTRTSLRQAQVMGGEHSGRAVGLYRGQMSFPDSLFED